MINLLEEVKVEIIRLRKRNEILEAWQDGAMMMSQALNSRVAVFSSTPQSEDVISKIDREIATLQRPRE